MKTKLIIIALLMFSAIYSVKAQSPFVHYEPLDYNPGQPKRAENIQKVRATGFFKNTYSQKYVQVSLILAITNSGESNESIKLIKYRQSGSDSNWTDADSYVYACQNNCSYTYYANSTFGYIYFDM